VSLQYRGRVPRSTSVVVACRLESQPAAFASSGNAFKQADFASIVYSVMDTTTGQPVSSNGVTYQSLPLTVSSVIFDTLQNWSEDSRGANFVLTVGPGAFPQGNHEYQVEVKFTMTDGRAHTALFDLTTEQVFSS